MSRNLNRYSERPWYAHGLVGLRVHVVTEDGTLLGPVFTVPVQPDADGINEATCYKDLQEWSPVTGWRVFPETIAAAAPPPAGHVIAGISCDCGFYAYDDAAYNPHYYDPAGGAFWGYGDENDERTAHHTVFAIVEGSGVITVASRGFRCSRMRILALIEPPAATHPIHFIREYQKDMHTRVALASARYGLPVLTLPAAVERWPLTRVERPATSLKD